MKDRNVYVNLFLSNSTQLDVAGKKVALSQSTQYPWDGDIAINIDKNSVGKFAMKIRIPGWVKNQVVPSDLYAYSDNKRLGYTCSVNGVAIDTQTTEDGYLTIDRKWKKGDVVRIHFDMQPRTVRANEKVEADLGMISIERGPLVYCAEFKDNDFDIMHILHNQNPQFEVIPNVDFNIKAADGAHTYKITQLATNVQQLAFDKQGRLTTADARLTLIPYYAWCHRGSGNMKVWIAQDLKATRPSEPATLASMSKIQASTRTPALTSINDRLVPKNGNDRSIPYYHWWPKNNSTEWITYTFPEEATVQSSTVYWFDDQPWGGCSTPESWKIYYKDASGNWQEVAHADNYPTTKGSACTVNFDPVSTKELKLEVKLPEKLSSGLFEWSVK